MKIFCIPRIDGFVKSLNSVTPAKAGVQKSLKLLDSAKASLRARLEFIPYLIRDRNDKKLYFPTYCETIRIRPNQRGAIFLGLIMVMVIFAAMGVALISMSITSTFSQVWTGSSSRAYYLAESGFRYAQTEFKNTYDGEMDSGVSDGSIRDDRNKKLISWHSSLASPVLFTFVDTRGRTMEKFELKIYPYFLVTSASHAAGAITLTAKFPGEKPADLTLPPGAAPGKLRIGTNPPHIYTYQTYNYDSGTKILTFNTISPGLKSAVSDNMDVYWVANPAASQPISKDGSLTLADASLFPGSNGVFRIDGGDGTVYGYKSKDVATNTLQGLFDVYDPTRIFAVTVVPANNIVLNPFIKLHSIGIFDYGAGVENRHEIEYNVPLTTDEKERVEFKDTFENPDKWQTSTLGSHAIQTIGGDKALKVTGTGTVGGSDVGSLIKLKGKETNPHLSAAYKRAGNFLSYDAPVKVGFTPDVPTNYAAGISFRLDDNNNSYGLLFLRGESLDTIPDGIEPAVDKSMIVLWQQTDSGATKKWLAYKDISAPGSLFDNVESGENGWTKVGVQPASLTEGLWHISARKSYTTPTIPSHSWYYGQESTANYDYKVSGSSVTNSGTLVSQPINLCSATFATLSFWSWHKTEPYDPGNPAWVNLYDIKWVDVYDGTNWIPVYQILYPGHPMDTWNHVTVDLSAYKGKSIKIRFRFDTRDAQLNNFEGWYIDDISINSDASFALNEATLLVRIQEANSITFISGSKGSGTKGIKADDKIIGQTSHATATVISTPIVGSGSWDSGSAAGTILLHDVNGIFSDGEQLNVVVGSTATATAKNPMYLPSNSDPNPKRANFIRAYYGNPGDCGSPNNSPLDDNKHGIPSNTDPGNIKFYWPPDEVQDWAATNDYYRLIQWDVVRAPGEVPVAQAIATLKRITSINEPKAIIQSTENVLLTPLPGPFVQAELGLHTFGNNSTSVYFDDFALQTILYSTGEFLPSIQE